MFVELKTEDRELDINLEIDSIDTLQIGDIIIIEYLEFKIVKRIFDANKEFGTYVLDDSLILIVEEV